MATKDKLSAVHNDLAAWSAGGSVGLLLSMSSYFLGEEYSRKHQKNTLSQIVEGVSLILFMGSLAVLVIALSFHRDEKEELGESIPDLIAQVRRKNAQPDWNEPALLASLSSLVLLVGAAESLRHKKTENAAAFGWIGPLLYSVGWIGNAYAAATPDQDLSHVRTSRLKWTMPGAAAIVSGSLMLLWQERENYINGPAWPLTTVGLLLFSIGNSMVEKPFSLS